MARWNNYEDFPGPMKALDSYTAVANAAYELARQELGGNVPEALDGRKLTGRSRLALLRASAEAAALGHNYVGTEHLLLGLMEPRESVAATVLRDAGIELNTLRAAVGRYLGGLEHEKEEIRRCHCCGAGTRNLSTFEVDAVDQAVNDMPKTIQLCDFCSHTPLSMTYRTDRGSVEVAVNKHTNLVANLMLDRLQRQAKGRT